MNERDLVITIACVVARGTSRPQQFLWKVSAQGDEPVEEVGKAITDACREINSALKEAAR